MHFKNFESQPKVGSEYAGLKRDGEFLFPSVVKYVAWSFVAVIVISSSLVLVYYGKSFAMMRISLWMAFLILSVCLSILIISPMRIVLFSLISVMFTKRKSIIIKRRLFKFLVKNPEDSPVKKQVLRFRQYNANLYAPTPLWKLESLKEDVKYNIELQNLALDVLSQALIIVIIISLINPHFSETDYYSTDVVRKLVLNANYTKSIPFSKVTSYDMLMEYLRETFIPAVLMKPTEDADVFGKGWTMDFNLKLLGRPRIRQIRVKADSCKELFQLKAKNMECASDLTLFNIEKGGFSLRWNALADQELTPRQASPWKYEPARKTQSLPVYGRFFVYPGGGYILDLARDVNSSLITVKYAEEVQWIDTRTRAVFIEFTVYCVNTNLFNIVTLIAEKTSLGYFVTSYQIFTSRLVFSAAELNVMFTLKALFFICLLLIVLLREAVRVHRTSIFPYLKRGFALLDVTFILLELTFIFGQIYYVPFVVKKLQHADKSEFINLTHPATWDYWWKIINASLIILSTFKLFGVLAFSVVLFKFQTTLIFCYKYLMKFCVYKLILTFAFAFFFYLTWGNFVYLFSSFRVSVLTAILRSLPNEDPHHSEAFNVSPRHLGPVLFIFIFIPLTILFGNVLTAVTCLYLQRVQKLSLVDKYDISVYIKYVLTRPENILHVKEREVAPKEPAVMRLKGGGGGGGGGGEGDRGRTIMKKKKRKKKTAEAFALKIKAKDFVTEKLFDMTEYQDLAVDRTVAMKHLTLSLLPSKKRRRNRARQKALEALFCSLTDEKRRGRRRRTSQGPYFFVESEDSVEVDDGGKFLEMKRIVEEMMRCEGWLKEEERICEELSKAENKLSVLNKKLCRLVGNEKPKWK